MVFGWYIVAYLFLAGAGAGAFCAAACACAWDAVRRSDASERLARTCQAGFYAAPCLVVLAALFLLLDLGNAQRAWLVLATPLQSVMSVGAWLVALLVAVSGAVAVRGLTASEVPRSLLGACCAVGVPCALGVMGYTGLLLSDLVSIDFWHTPWLIALFVASSLSCGIAAIVALDAALAPPSYVVSRGLWRAGAVLGCVEAAVLAVFLVVQSGFTDTARASCELLLSGALAPAFWGGVCAVGLALPLAAHAAGSLLPERAAMLGSSLGVLVGGLLLRYCIVAAAFFTPLALGAI
ncbi:polysulfide reductase NrfD [Eggerthella sp. NSJ-70]|uniref:Polysulfide reductase NrfD n=1 Tax=Eggerthella hominis TaxID=2763043 RepID=A0ABR7BUP9_9ACTN|nr:polysulfide reductase NrfD [Eggerthella hominis]